MWINTILDAWIDFTTVIVGFSVAVIGILSKTTLENKKWPKNITFFGWVLVVFALINLSFSWHQNYQKIKKQEEVRYWAILEIEKATCDLITPYFLNSDPPVAEDRFRLSEYLTNPDIIMSIVETDLRAPVGRQYEIWEIGSAQDTWAEVLTKHTKNGSEKLKSILSNYSSILSTETIALIGQLTIHPWLEFVGDSQKRRLKNLERNPESNHLILGSDSKKLKLKYVVLAVDFGKKLNLLETNINKQYESLYKKLDRKDPVPLFYRQFSGLIYLPKYNNSRKKYNKANSADAKSRAAD